MTYNIWEVDANQMIYYWNGAAGWTQVPGSLLSIAVGSGQVWGINSLQKIYRWNGTGWMQIPGSLVRIAVGDDGQVWGINGLHNIYQWNGTGWMQVPGSLVSIAVASDGQVWGTNEHQLIYRWNGTAWTQIPGNLDSITAGASMVWGLRAGLIYRQTMMGWMQLDSASLSTASIAVASPSAPPPAVLGSNSNYILYSDCNPVTNLSVTMNVTQDIVGSVGVGFSVQLNAFSAPNENYSYQQYCITIDGSRNPPEIECVVCNWPRDSTHLLIDQSYDLCPLPNANLSAGSQLKISLANDTSGNVNAATFVVVDNTGSPLANKTVTLLSLRNVNGDSVTSADLAPITAFQVNLVGSYGGKTTVFSSGSGTITYAASDPLTALNQNPTCIESTTPGTAETSNSKYGLLPWTSNKTLVQSFICVSAPPT
jgi:hypothetical protein